MHAGSFCGGFFRGGKAWSGPLSLFSPNRFVVIASCLSLWGPKGELLGGYPGRIPKGSPKVVGRFRFDSMLILGEFYVDSG